MQPTHVLAGIVVDDIERAVTWYADLFGRQADTVPMPSCHEWKLGTDVTVQVHQNPTARPGHSSIALVVSDLDRALEEVGRAEFGQVQVVPDFVRTATASDPDGNQVTLVESIG